MSGIIFNISGTSVTFDKDGNITENWDDGKLVSGVTGGTHSYIPKHFRINVIAEKDDKYAYAPWADFEALCNGNVNPTAAMAIVASREVIMDLGVSVNLSEAVVLDADIKVVTAKFITTELNKCELAISNVVNQAVSIFAANAICLSSTGHHYRDSDKIFGRLVEVTDLATPLSEIHLNESNLFHDVFHVFDMHSQVRWLYDKSGKHKAKMNSVVRIRSQILPAGTAFLGSFASLLDALQARYGNQIDLKSAITAVNALVNTIRISPLDWTDVLGTQVSATNKAVLDRAKLAAAYAFGMARVVKELNRSSFMKAESLKQLSELHPAKYQGGLVVGKYLSELIIEEIKPDSLAELLAINLKF